MDSVPTSVNVRHYAQVVADKSALRRMIRANEEIANMCYLDKEPVENHYGNHGKAHF